MKLSRPLSSVLSAFLLLAVGSAQQASTILQRHDFGRRSARYSLPDRLDEISGLATTSDGRLFGHDDERAMVYEIDRLTGKIGKRYSLGSPALRGDFEGMAIVGRRIFLITRHGLLYEFREVADGEGSPYRVTDTRLGSRCEVEGLDYDPSDDVLLVACKVSVPERGVLVVHRLSMDPDRGRLAAIEIPRAQLVEQGVEAGFQPSSIVVDPSGSLVLASASTEALIEIDRYGRVLAGVQLSPDRHPQPEGLAFGPDGTLFIADERNRGDARLTAYARREVTGSGR